MAEYPDSLPSLSGIGAHGVSPPLPPFCWQPEVDLDASMSFENLAAAPAVGCLRTKRGRRAERAAMAAALIVVPGAQDLARQAAKCGVGRVLPYELGQPLHGEHSRAGLAADALAARDGQPLAIRRVLDQQRDASAARLGNAKSIVAAAGAAPGRNRRFSARHLPDGPQQDEVSDRGRRYWRQRQAVRMVPEIPGLRSCLRKNLDGVSVSVVKAEKGAGYRGLMRCAGVWTCPCCAPRIAAARTAEIEAGIVRHVALAQEEGHFSSEAEAQEAVAMMTLTLRHRVTDSPVELLAALRDAMRRMRQHRAWKRLSKSVRGTITALEMTYGRHGFHPHLHLLLLGVVPAEELDHQLRTLREIWSESLQQQGRECGRAGFRVDVRRGAAAHYVSKLAWEAAGSVTKEARGGGSRTGWQLLHDACEGDVQAVGLWREYALATAGRNWLTWSPGLKAKLAVEEVDDEEIVEEDAGATTVAVLSSNDWRAVVLTELRGQLLDAADAEGEAGVWRVVDLAHSRIVVKPPPDVSRCKSPSLSFEEWMALPVRPV